MAAVERQCKYGSGQHLQSKLSFAERHRAFHDLIKIKRPTPARWADNVNAVANDMRFVIIGAVNSHKHFLQILAIALLLAYMRLYTFVTVHIVKVTNNIS